MRLEKASRDAVKYACLNFHYSKSVPVNPVAFSVFNDKNEWCGCILYGYGAANNIARPFGLVQGNVIELTRMALNGKQGITSKCLSYSLKLIRKICPLVRLVVSYADSEQNHNGIIYQATNFFYIGYSSDTNLIINGKRFHRRTLGAKYKTSSIKEIQNMGHNVSKIITKPKYKYIYPLDNSLKSLCEKLKKPYPKKSVVSIDSDAVRNPSEEGGAVPTTTHQ